MAPDAQPLVVHIDDSVETVLVDPATGAITEMQPDGSAIVRLDERRKSKGLGPDGSEKWFRNLVDDIDSTQLGTIALDVIDGVGADESSRQGKLDDIAKGLELIGIELKDPSSDVNDSGTGPQISKVTNPLLLEAVLKGWANAQAEMLPASGPAKIKSDGMETSQEDQDAELLERGFNHFMTVTSTEYYPETSHMLLWGTYFSGSGFKKIYRCPMRRRAVAEMVETKDLIVSNTSKDLRNCGRITHQIMMRPSVFKRMQLIGAYAKTAMVQPNPQVNAVDAKIASIQGTQPTPDRPEDKPYTIWETQCELDLDDFIPNGSKFKDQGIPLPYLVTIDKDNEEVLAIRRDWDEDDEHCTRQRMYVRYPYIPGPGFYGTGMLNLLGNASAAMTAAWREALDAGMYANFPGGFMSKLGGRQINTDIKLSPGEFRPIETSGMPISQIITGLPYKDVTPGLMALMDKIIEQCRGLGQSAEIPSAEGLRDIPVGTMLAYVEQATKVMAAAHKGMHNAQSEELQLLIKLLRKHPEDMLKSEDNSPIEGWEVQRFLTALDNHKLVPVSDPNVPSHIHRVAKALGLVQLIQIPQFAARLNIDEVLKRILAAMREDPEGLQQPAPDQGAAPPDPTAMAKLITAKAKADELPLKQQDMANKTAIGAQKMQVDAAQQHSDQLTAQADITKELIIHQADAAKIAAAERRDDLAAHTKMALDTSQASMQASKQAHDAQQSANQHNLETFKAGVQAHDTAHQQQLGVAEHGLARDQHALEVQKAQAEHGLNTKVAAHDAAVKTHETLHPLKPAAAAKPKPKKKK